MARFPVDAPRDRVIKAFERLGFRLMREGNHIAMVRENPDDTRTPHNGTTENQLYPYNDTLVS
jgi:hypothetical protein